MTRRWSMRYGARPILGSLLRIAIGKREMIAPRVRCLNDRDFWQAIQDAVARECAKSHCPTAPPGAGRSSRRLCVYAGST